MVLLCALVVVSAAAAQQPVRAELYGPTLEPEPVTLIELDTDAQRLVYEDAEGLRHEAGFDAVVRLTFPVAAPAEQGPRAVLATTDGQRIVGQPGQSPHAVLGTDDVLGWRDTDGMPAIGVSLDDLAWAVFKPGRAAAPPAQPTDDVLWMDNGERLAGFVDTLGVRQVGFVIGEADDAVPVDGLRIAGLAMSNAMRDEDDGDAAEGVWVTMRSGSRWRGALRRSGGALAFASPLVVVPSGQGPGTPVWQNVRLGSADRPDEDGWPVVSRIDLPSAGRRLVALSSLPWSLASGGEVFGEPMPPGVTGDGAFALHAPVEVVFEVPAGGARLSATVALALGADVPAERRAWAGCEVVVRVGGEERARVALDAERSEQRVNLALPGSADGRPIAVTVAVEEGVNGPVLDRVELRDAEVLVQE